jgi:16S rRNA C967 or C1407 C5-methylase (RsmB/RsmF family)/NOL1/NOP2/fmu family ribosome biogenesis protein
MQMTLPTSLMNSLADAPGFNRAAFEEVHASGEKVTSIRINPLKIQHPPSAVEGSVVEPPSVVEPLSVVEGVPWSTCGYYLSKRPSFTLDPLLHAGCYYVQEASSMFLEQALRQSVDLSQDIKLLDLCAAPGGKSTLIQSLITPGSLLVSNEVIRARAGILQENITKWGGNNVAVTSNDPKDFARLENFFDVMVIDAPCSGSGLFRRDPTAIQEWSEENVILCSQRQQRILADALPSLKPGGILIYCTCSYSVEEDEAVADWLSGTFGVDGRPLSVPAEWNIVESLTPQYQLPCYRFYPDKLKGEGFFLACMQKPGGQVTAHRPSKQKPAKLSKAEQDMVKEWIDPAVPLHLFRHKEDIIAVPPSFENLVPYLQEHLYLRQIGTNLGKVVRKELLPDHALAMSIIFNNAITTISLNLEEALQYLRKAEVFPVASHKGWALVQYEGHNLGWVKMLANRLNNYYPKEWRILKS